MAHSIFIFIKGIGVLMFAELNRRIDTFSTARFSRLLDKYLKPIHQSPKCFEIKTSMIKERQFKRPV